MLTNVHGVKNGLKRNGVLEGNGAIGKEKCSIGDRRGIGILKD